MAVKSHARPYHNRHGSRRATPADRILVVKPKQEFMASSSSDPSVVRSIAVTVEDVVTALEMNCTSEKQAVLRVTPPFSGRMRARLHVDATSYTAETEPIHIPPERLVENPPAYPRPADTEDALRNDPDEGYTVERHHEWHTNAVAEWRESVSETITGHVTVTVDETSQTVSVTTLGEVPKSTQNGE